MNVRLTKEQKGARIMEGKDVFKIMREVILRESKYGQEMEHSWIMSLGPDNLILNLELGSLGSNRRALLEPMQVFRIALIKNADKIIMVHNHVDQELIPSQEDMDTTDRMIKVGEIIKIRKEAEQIGMEKGIKIGREEGEKSKAIEMAQKMKKAASTLRYWSLTVKLFCVIFFYLKKGGCK